LGKKIATNGELIMANWLDIIQRLRQLPEIFNAPTAKRFDDPPMGGGFGFSAPTPPMENMPINMPGGIMGGSFGLGHWLGGPPVFDESTGQYKYFDERTGQYVYLPSELVNMPKGGITNMFPAGGMPSGGFGFGTGSQNVITPFEQLAFDILQRMGGIQSPLSQTEEERFAIEQAKQFFGPLGQSPYTLEALKAWETLTKPQIEQAMAIQGTYAPSGAFAETLARARTEATVPLLMQDLQSRLNLIPQLIQAGQFGRQLGLQSQIAAASGMMGLGNTLANRFNQSLMNAYGMAGMPREMAQQQIGEMWKALGPLYNAYGQLYFGPFTGMFGTGSTTTTKGGGWGIGK
jgi:hypothetical protein